MTNKSNTLPMGYHLHRYRIESVLGAGGFGITYKAVHKDLQSLAAIKEYFPVEWSYRDRDDVNVLANTQGGLPTSEVGEEACYAWGLERFLYEAQILAQVKHPGVVRVRDFFKENGTAYIVMDYEDGEPLSHLLRRTATLSEAYIRQFLDDVLPALEAVHALGYLHRDLKPANLYRCSDGRTILIDFGAARQALSQRSKNITSVFTVGYSPIEQYLVDSKSYGPWTDVYALGAVLYQCVTGKMPVEAPARVLDDPLKPAVEAAAGLYSPRLLRLIDRSIAIRPEKRFQSIAEVRAALEAAQLVEDLGAVEDEGRTVKLELPVRLDSHRNSKRSLSDQSLLPPVVIAEPPAPEPIPAPTPVPTPKVITEKPKKPRQQNWRWAVSLLVVIAVLGGGIAILPPIFSEWNKKDPQNAGQTSQAGQNNQAGQTEQPSQTGQAGQTGQAAQTGQPAQIAQTPQTDNAKPKVGPPADPKPGQLYTDSVTGMGFVWIAPGCFMMGSPETEKERSANEIPHQVCPAGVWMGQQEVTNAQYRLFNSQHDSGSYETYSLNNPAQPVAKVSWQEAVAYADWLSGQTGLRFRLPTEAEWEYGARAGKTESRDWRDDPKQACRYANIYDETARKAKPFNWANYPCEDGQVAAAPVGKYGANTFGLYDMLGNVAEWTCSEYDSGYQGGESRCADRSTTAGRRVLRGGSWSDYPGLVRFAYRFPAAPEYRKFDLGFRLVLEP